jgi:hypothetical protein
MVLAVSFSPALLATIAQIPLGLPFPALEDPTVLLDRVNPNRVTAAMSVRLAPQRPRCAAAATTASTARLPRLRAGADTCAL